MYCSVTSCLEQHGSNLLLQQELLLRRRLRMLARLGQLQLQLLCTVAMELCKW